jgi:NCAIR mutase (PurE)-related protein
MLDFTFDFPREERLGFSEAIYCEGKSTLQIERIVEYLQHRQARALFTRLPYSLYMSLSPVAKEQLRYDRESRTASLEHSCGLKTEDVDCAVVTAGSSDLGTAKEAVATMKFFGYLPKEIHDVGVAGLWRLLEQQPVLAGMDVIIVCAGMDGALPTVVAGLVPGLVIAVPTSVGYGVSTGGRVALESMLSSCAPGLVVVNVDNGYGAACAAIRYFQRRTASS